MTDLSLTSPIRPVTSAHAHKLFLRGLIVSVLYIFLLSAYAWSMRQVMFGLKPDEFATFLSGVFAPLAFLWLVLGFRQQGDELQNSARALYLQGEELRNSVEQQRQLVEVQREQLVAERETREVEERRVREQSQPRLRLNANGSVHSNGAGRYSFSLTNVGPTCSDVVLAAEEHDVQGRSATLGIGSYVTIEVEHANNSELAAFHVRADYLDSQGHPGIARFHVPLTGPEGQRGYGAPQTVSAP
jgi:hypothetical protein